MGILADFEDSIGKVIEGTFGGIFRSHVQPAEIARQCAKEMDRSKKLGVGKVYVANFFTIVLSPRDSDALGGLMSTLKSELETYLLAHSRENNYQLPTHPTVHFVSDPDLRLGRFDVVGETMSQTEIDKELGLDEELDFARPLIGERPAAAPARSSIRGEVAALGAVAAPPVSRSIPSAESFADAGPPPAPRGIDGERPMVAATPSADRDFEPTKATITSPLLGTYKLDTKDLYTIGRKDTCDISLEDSATSRLHATLMSDNTGWILTDNDATNTTQVNGRAITSRKLRTGDVITIGTTQFTYRTDDTPDTESLYPPIKGFV